ncbi:magnesium transporter [Deinobacterium chartae]|uniref:Magnesium transporter n=1 Tax=Deinobacterium chartae TaxID=521158 RepID=A0A841I329_9DEIO|nr:magnesium transporter CorA family protein [Deinobacterium chartae]MBB6098820.1 magnesium transporter [Deinobacterium chartae]
MLEFYRSIGGKLTRQDGYVDNGWINAVAPTPAELQYLHTAFGIPQDYLSYPLDLDERPRFEKEDGFTLIVMQTSYPLGEHSDIPYDTIPLGIIHAEHCIVTICTMPNPVIEEIKRGTLRHVSTAKKNRFTLQIFLRTAQRYLIDLRRIDKQVDAVEDRLENSTRNRELLELLKLEKSLVYFKTALKANELMMERIKRDRVFEMYPDDQDLLDDVLIENLQAIEMTDITTNILTSMMGAFASVISNNVNAVVKLLTTTTILIAIPTLITSVFGMNVPLPWQESPTGMLWVLAIAFGLSGTMAFLFWRWKWF